MSTNWLQAYTALTAFIARHSEIEVGASVTTIPDSVRLEFYRLFDDVTATFLEERFSPWLNEAKTISRSYLKAEQEVIKLLGVVDVTLPANLHHFLHNPISGLTRLLSNQLFDLLKGQVNTGAFEQKATKIIERSFRDLYHSGYVKWLGLSLVRLLEADKAFDVVFSEGLEDETNWVMSYNVSKSALPEESRHLCFNFGQEFSFQFVVPEFIVHSAKTDRYVAVTSALVMGRWTASNASDTREWYPIDAIRSRHGPAPLKPDLLIYIGDSPKDIALVADADKICRPDLIIECREQKDWYEKEGLTNVKRHHAALKPKLGTFIVSREPVPEQAYQEITQEQESEKQRESIHILTVGLDQSKLEPIISILKNPGTNGLLSS